MEQRDVLPADVIRRAYQGMVGVAVHEVTLNVPSFGESFRKLHAVDISDEEFSNEQGTT